jgi:hypothetical protein
MKMVTLSSHQLPKVNAFANQVTGWMLLNANCAHKQSQDVTNARLTARNASAARTQTANPIKTTQHAIAKTIIMRIRIMPANCATWNNRVFIATKPTPITNASNAIQKITGTPLQQTAYANAWQDTTNTMGNASYALFLDV